MQVFLLKINEGLLKSNHFDRTTNHLSGANVRLATQCVAVKVAKLWPLEVDETKAKLAIWHGHCPLDSILSFKFDR